MKRQLKYYDTIDKTITKTKWTVTVLWIYTKKYTIWESRLKKLIIVRPLIVPISFQMNQKSFFKWK